MQKSLVALLILLCASIGWAGSYPVTYTYTGGTIAGAGAAAETASPYVLTDGYITTQALIDAAAGSPQGYYVNGGQDDGVIYGDANDVHPGVLFDLGAAGDLNMIEIHYVVHTPHGVAAPASVDVSVDGAPVTTFAGFDMSANVGAYGDARFVRIDVAGNNGQLVQLDFHSSWEWTSLNEVVVYEPNELFPLVITGPDNVVALSGDTVEFSVAAAWGGGGYGYQWRKGGVDLNNGAKVSGATTNTLTITDVDTSFNDPNYSCLVTSVDSPGGVESSHASLTVVQVPDLTDYGQRVMATGPVAYYSFDEGSGNVAAELVSLNIDKFLQSTTPIHTANGAFGTAVDTSGGNATTHPERTDGVWIGDPAVSVAEGNGYAMEWMMKWNGSALEGNILRSPSDLGTTTWETFWDEAKTGLKVYVQPSYNNMLLDSAADDPNFLSWHHMVWVQASDGSGTLYVDGAANTSWYWRSGTAPTGAQELNFTDLMVGGYPHVTYGRAFRGEIDEVAFYDLGGISDQAAAGAVIASHGVNTGAAYVAQAPADAFSAPGGSVEFVCVAAGAPTISYQWKKNDVDLSDDATFAGTATSILTVSDIPFAMKDSVFTCAVSNGEGGATSAGATLTVDCYWDIPVDIDGDCDVDMVDVEIFAQYWLADSKVPQP